MIIPFRITGSSQDDRTFAERGTIILDFESNGLEDPEISLLVVEFWPDHGPKIKGKVIWASKIWYVVGYNITGYGPNWPVKGRFFLEPVRHAKKIRNPVTT